MPRFLSFVLFPIALLLASCGPSSLYVEGSYDNPNPGYVYSYPGGGCWADGIWYETPCPWSFGPHYGYYYYHGGGYYRDPHYHWGYRPGHPPRVHRPTRPSPGYRAPNPVIIRDHRRHHHPRR